MKKCICISLAASCMHMLYADVYFNSKTFLQSEKIDDIVYIGHENATDGGDPANALVTVESGAAWTNTKTVILGKYAGTAQLTVKSGASVNFETLSIAEKPCANGTFELQENAFATVSNLSVAALSSSEKEGRIQLAENSVVSNVYRLGLGRSYVSGSIGRIELNGGRIYLWSTNGAPEISMEVGVNGDSCGGIVQGWGSVGFDNAYLIMNKYASVLGREKWGGFKLYGQIIADGNGVERDLDFSKIGVPNGDVPLQNRCGTNGWYAINKGRLLMPRSLWRVNKYHNSIGGSPVINLERNIKNAYVNSFVYTFENSSDGGGQNYIWSELYATDRTDIPAGLPFGERYHISSVWRIGFFTRAANATQINTSDAYMDRYKQDFDRVKLKFHYDPNLAKNKKVNVIKVYRCAKKDKSDWVCIGTAVPSTSDPYIETAYFDKSPDVYNFGWFAIVGEDKIGTTVVLR